MTFGLPCRLGLFNIVASMIELCPGGAAENSRYHVHSF
jgi:hypothetical protein